MRSFFRGVVSLGVALMFVAVVGCTKLPPPTPLSQLNEQQMFGHDVFHQQCLQCHNDRINQSLQGPTLRGIFKKQYLSSGTPANDENVQSIIVFGYGIMPPMGRNVSPEERAALLAYLHTL
jgi:mono/diheme cytochrome c family protein